MQEGIDSNFSEWDFITTGSAGSGSGNGSAGETLARTESNTVQSMTVSHKQANRRAALLRGNRKRRRGRRSAHAGETASKNNRIAQQEYFRAANILLLNLATCK
jgi:hypothetical protein